MATPTPVDPVFGDPRLARLYDVFDGERTDLPAYEALVAELGARRVLDVGCGTGELALRLAGAGLEVTGVDPATASLDVARTKPGADRVRWVAGHATAVTGPSAYDVAVMTGNVAMALLDDQWPGTLAAVRALLAPRGHLVLESRVPARRAWEGWTPDATRQSATVTGADGSPDTVETWCEVIEVAPPRVAFRWSFAFGDGTRLTSDSTLEFRELAGIEADLAASGYDVVDVRDAPDRPGLEHVVVARVR